MRENREQGLHKGSSLMFVIIAIAFVGILATIVLRISLININIKSVDQQAKKDFYSADAVMDKVDLVLQNKALECMQTSYSELLGSYASLTENTSNQDKVQTRFAYSYLNEMVEFFYTGAALQQETDGSYSLNYAQYYPQKIKDLLDTNFGSEVSKYFVVDSDTETRTMELHFDNDASSEKYLLLKDVKVEFYQGTDATNADAGTSSEITTDLKIIVPDLSFASANIYPEFTKFALIGDEQICTEQGSGANANINGYVYAGYKDADTNGFHIKGGTINILGGQKLITRGDIKVRQGTKLNIGESTSKAEVWTENYKTDRLNTAETSSTGTQSEANLLVYADSYVHDDLSLDAPYSSVSFNSGNYYGYTFNQNNVNSNVNSTTVDSQYSSAILINGKHSALFMGDELKTILLGGRAFVSRMKEAPTSQQNSNRRTDIPLGQSVSVKSDQTFYKVETSDMMQGFQNPMTKVQYEANCNAGKCNSYRMYGNTYQTVITDETRRNLSSYLNPTEPVTTYVFNLSNASEDAAMIYFYYNFKNEDAADEFFKDKCDANQMFEKIKSSEYLQFGTGGISGLDIQISENLTLFSASNAITKVTEDSISVQNPSISSSSLSNYYQQSIEYASKYKSYELTLTASDMDKYIREAQSRGAASFDLVDKAANQIFDTKLMAKNDSDVYKFVEDSTSDPDTTGFKAKTATVKIKSVEVSLSDTTNGYAVFVASTTPEDDTINLTDILTSQYVPGYEATNNNKNLVMIVANCNVCVNQSLKGLVISDGKISFKGGIYTIDADSAGIQSMITAQKKLEGSVGEDKKFLNYFTCFEDYEFGADDDSDQNVNISQYIKHQNWRKNDD